MSDYPRARYFASRNKKLLVIEHKPNHGVSTKETLLVSGKVEARKITVQKGAVAWNF